MQKTLPKLGVVGLGKLGAPMAAVFSAAGYNVLGADLSLNVVGAINNAQAPLPETDLQKFISLGKTRLRATIDICTVGIEADIIFIIVPTPSAPNHKFSNDYLLSAINSVGEGIRQSGADKLVVITSTVMPSTTDNILSPALESASGRKLGGTLGLCYNPEFIALGSIIQDMLFPDFILIGESQRKWGDMLEAVYEKSCHNRPPIRRMNFVNAEITKISINTFTTTKISYANTLSEICSKIEGADVDVVSNAVGSDSRIGVKYLKGGVGYGGPCFPRDNKAFIALANDIGANAAIARATDTVNDHQLERLVQLVVDQNEENAKIGIIGLSYKDNTQVTEASHGFMLAEVLIKRNKEVLVFDEHIEDVPDGCCLVSQLSDVMECASLLVLMLPLSSIVTEIAGLAKFGLEREITIIDPWRIGRELEGLTSINYVPMGIGR